MRASPKPALRKGRVVIFAERPDGHAGLIAKAMRKLRIPAVIASLRDCNFSTGAPYGLVLPGFGHEPPDAVFVRAIPAGSFEQVTLRLGILHALRGLGVPVWNDARAIECCIDKSMTSHLLVQAGLQTPPTFTAQSRTGAMRIAGAQLAENRVLVLKPLFGAQGRGLKLIKTVDDLPEEAETASLYYLQQFVEPAEAFWQDYRVLVCSGEAIAGMSRTGKSWITNIHQGAEAQPLLLTDEFRATAIAAARAVGAEYAGVDIIRTRSGALQVLEVNSMPAWSGLQTVTGFDIAAHIARRFALAINDARTGQSRAGEAGR